MLELSLGSDPVIDYDCAPTDYDIEPYADRITALGGLVALKRQDLTRSHFEQIQSHATYLAALLGERLPLSAFVRRTQGCNVSGWTEEYLRHRQELAQRALTDLGISWSARTFEELGVLEPSIPAESVGDQIKTYAAQYERDVRETVGSYSQFNLQVEPVSSDSYWSYWLDGSGHDARLRINLARASFTATDAYRFALHEILGHALQYASLSDRVREGSEKFLPILAVHSNHQVVFEGLAQIFPLLFDQSNSLVEAFVRLDHYRQLVRAELHLLVNSGASVLECRDKFIQRLPFVSDSEVEREIRDRSLNPRLRSYLWAYPAGLDWFMCLYEERPAAVKDVLRAAYRKPLTPNELSEFWPNGPVIGGDL